MNVKKMTREKLLSTLMEAIKENEELKAENTMLKKNLDDANRMVGDLTRIAKVSIEKNKVHDALNSSAAAYFEECEKYKDMIIKYAIRKAESIIRDAEDGKR